MVYLDLSERENKYWTTSYKGLQQGLNFMGEEGSGVCAGANPCLAWNATTAVDVTLLLPCSELSSCSRDPAAVVVMQESHCKAQCRNECDVRS